MRFKRPCSHWIHTHTVDNYRYVHTAGKCDPNPIFLPIYNSYRIFFTASSNSFTSTKIGFQPPAWNRSYEIGYISPFAVCLYEYIVLERQMLRFLYDFIDIFFINVCFVNDLLNKVFVQSSQLVKYHIDEKSKNEQPLKCISSKKIVFCKDDIDKDDISITFFHILDCVVSQTSSHFL